MWMCVTALLACSEYGYQGSIEDVDEPREEGTNNQPPGNGGPHDGDRPGDTGAVETYPDDTDGGPGDGPPGDDTGTPEIDIPPTYLDGDCEEGTMVELSAAELVVMSWDPTTAEATLEVAEQGVYHMYNTHIVESGASQWNESAYFRVVNASVPDGEPLLANCDVDYVVQDADNLGPPLGTRTYVGTFWLDPGTNTFRMSHYCPVYRAGVCPEHHIPDEPEATCDSGNVNSVHFSGYGLCLVPV